MLLKCNIISQIRFIICVAQLSKPLPKISPPVPSAALVCQFTITYESLCVYRTNTHNRYWKGRGLPADQITDPSSQPLCLWELMGESPCDQTVEDMFD